MNLVLVNYEYPPLGGGAGVATRQLALALARQGHRVTVLTTGLAADVGTVDEAPGLRVVRLAARRRHRDRASLAEMASFVAAAWPALPPLARAAQADGLVVFFALPCGPLAWHAQRRTGVPYVVSLRGGDVPGTDARVTWLHRLLAPARRGVLRNARAVVANSAGLAELARRGDGIPVEVVENGVDTEEFAPGAAATDPTAPLRLLFVGRYQPQKNLFVLLQQVALASRQAELRLAMVGDGPQAPELRAEAARLGIVGIVDWHGWLDRPALGAVYQAADVFLNPSLYEGLPNTVLEAMACGLPVIASRVIGNRELVDHDATGVLVELAEPDALAAAIVRLARDPALRGRLGAEARQRACAGYSWDRAAARYADLFARP